MVPSCHEREGREKRKENGRKCKRSLGHRKIVEGRREKTEGRNWNE